MSVIIKGEFKGRPIISFKRDEDDEKFWFGFGVGKAEAILEHIDEVKAFVEEHGSPPAKAKKGK